MKTIHIQSTVLLQTVIRKVVEQMQILNAIPEKDFEKIVKAAQARKPYLKKCIDNLERGNIFLTLFFIRELLEDINLSDE